MKSNVEYFPVLDQTVTPSAGSSAFAGGAVVAVTSEGNVPSNTTQPQFKQLALSTLKLLAYSEVSNEMLDNSSPAVAPIVENAVRVAINSFIDSDVIFGAGGTSALTGLMDNAATKQISRAGSSTVTAPDIFGMYAGLLPSSRNTAMWICFPTVLPQLFAIGSAYQYIFLQNNITGKPAMSLLGLPLVTHEAMATLGLSGDIMLIDMKQYLIGINKQLAFDASPHVKFTSDITTFRASIRVAGKPKFSAQFILMDGSSTVSPYIQLDRYGSAS
jgi:HK97 family phage major capsid protein